MSARVMEGSISSVKLGTTWKQTWLVGVLEARLWTLIKVQDIRTAYAVVYNLFKRSLLEIMLACSESDIRILLRLEGTIMKTMWVYQG
jgi:hypothetical protein